MNKKDKGGTAFSKIKQIIKSVKRSYLCRLISKFLSVVCTIILIILVIIGSMMFYFNMKAKAFRDRGQDYTAPFGLYTIISGSMEPNVEVYDVVIARDYDVSEIKVGDIITFISNWDINYGVTVTHRVVAISKNEIGEYQLTTKGDNNGSKDGGTVTQTNLVGKVVGRIPQLGRLQFFLATKMGWFMVVFIPALGIIIFDMIKIFKLYVLKSQIDNVKTTKEAEKQKTTQKLEEKKEELIELKNKTIAPREENTSTKKTTKKAPKKIKEDENIDTVELPKIGSDGKITENTSELPSLTNKEEKEDTKSFNEIVLPDHIEDDSNIENEIPILKKDNDQTDIQRKKIRKRKN